MASLIYSDKSFLSSLKIEGDGGHITVTKKTPSGTNVKRIDLKKIHKIRISRGLTSYSLHIERPGEDSFSLDGFTEEAVEKLRRHLDSAVEIKKSEEKSFITPNEAKAEIDRLMSGLDESFDGRMIISLLVKMAVGLGSSDLHFNPGEKEASIRVRIDGLLYEVGRIPVEGWVRLAAALKNTARLASYKKSTPQDGSFHFNEEGIELDVRCATIPTMFGEKIVLRLLNRDKSPLFLEDLGLSPVTLKTYLSLIAEPQGAVILTGPAGSGKTTTIFASLIQLYNSYGGAVNIATIEDPVEYIIEEFQQTEIKPESGMSIAKGLKSLLRLDPDVMLVGEIRDPETAGAAVRSALSGHLLFTTLHARDSFGVFPRLSEMGISPYLIASSVTAVLYQRLIRKLCPGCKRESEVPKALDMELKRAGIGVDKYFEAAGCEECGQRGYSGRIGIFELLPVDEKIREMIAQSVPVGTIREKSIEEGFHTLRYDALCKAAAGITDYDEILRVCPR